MNKLVKITHKKQIFGVCEGLANYFNVDATLIRVGFAVASFLTAFTVTVPLYLILAVIMPNDYDVDSW